MNVPEHLQANVACYNQDARDFVRCRVRALQEDPQVGRRVHIVANLPASAPEFMDAFANIFSKGAWSGGLPTMHLYAFSRSAEGARDEVLARASAALPPPLNPPCTLSTLPCAPLYRPLLLHAADQMGAVQGGR